MADINITITIPDAWVSRVQAALSGQAEKEITIQFENAFKGYSYAAKGADNWIEFAGRAFKEHLKQQVKVYELSLDQIRFDSEINAIDQPAETVPEDIFTVSK